MSVCVWEKHVSLKAIDNIFKNFILIFVGCLTFLKLEWLVGWLENLFQRRKILFEKYIKPNETSYSILHSGLGFKVDKWNLLSNIETRRHTNKSDKNNKKSKKLQLHGEIREIRINSPGHWLYEKSVCQWSRRPGFSPRSSHTKDSKNGTWCRPA